MGRSTVNLNMSASFAADPLKMERIPTGRQIDWANVGNEYRTTPGLARVTVAVSATANVDATSISFAALTGPIPSGTRLDFGGKKTALTTAAAVAGDTSVAVSALAAQLTNTDVATYAGTAGSGNKVLPAGTPVGDLLGSGKLSPRVVTTNPAIGLLETDAVENDPTAASSGYSVINGGPIYENLLPAAWLSGTPKVLATAVKNELNTAGVGSFRFFQYNDAR